MATDEYTCAQCGGTFAKTWSDQEALDESRSIFGDVPLVDLVQICDDCFNEVMAGLN